MNCELPSTRDEGRKERGSAVCHSYEFNDFYLLTHMMDAPDGAMVHSPVSSMRLFLTYMSSGSGRDVKCGSDTASSVSHVPRPLCQRVTERATDGWSSSPGYGEGMA